jgi:heat shock protein 5
MGRLSKEDIERMVQEAEEFASEDEAQKECIEALNNLSSFIYSLKGQLADQDGLKKLDESVPEHQDMIFRKTFGRFADLMTGE